ncbi:snoRNA-binding rRNA-processing protein utp10 [Neophaeococcomyces mojaviensis]|uniref:SnoRNA-binding rRNA-processing protein utp10 n=1 Tax=Neophaeococcomyces mojaviensis TaxID=3383035 RepID=A0ACC3AGX7_9EURO|nr:snoRNA-binding rRNA-processing protein utp10 [Knufia sp. JES_112]
MVSAFASQLQAIAKNSSHELDLKAQRSAHGESLLFDRSVAVKQDFETIYNICVEGFRELCYLDQRFHDFERNVFSEQSKSQDREQMNKAENEVLDLVLKRCLALLGSKILLKPALKAAEWLVRRFRVHIYNVDDLLHTLLPYHEAPIWASALSIIPEDQILGQWKFIRPYLRTTWNVPRHAVAYAAAHNDPFFTAMNHYVLETCRQGLGHSALMTYWSSIAVEAVSNRLMQTRSGRKEVQRQRTEDQLLKILPVLSEGYEIPGCADLITACYTLTVVVASKAELDDHLLDSLLLEVANSISTVDGDAASAIITISLVTMQKDTKRVPRKVVDVLTELDALGMLMNSAASQYPLRLLLLALINTAVSHIKHKNATSMALSIEKFVRLLRELYPSMSTSDAFRPVLSKVMMLDPQQETDLVVCNTLITMLQRMNESEVLSIAISEAAQIERYDSTKLEDLLGMTVALLQQPYEPMEVEMTDQAETGLPADSLFDSLPHVWEEGSSFLAANDFDRFSPLAAAFAKSAGNGEMLARFSELPVWSSVLNGKLLWQTFLLRFACTNSKAASRLGALELLSQSIKQEPGCNVQSFIPYTLSLLADDFKIVRRSASSFLILLHSKLNQPSAHHEHQDKHNFYNTTSSDSLETQNVKHLSEVVASAILPVLEECVLDHTYIVKVVQNAVGSKSSPGIKKVHRQAFHSLLIRHALDTHLLRTKYALVSMLAGDNARTDVLLPILQEWTTLSDEAAKTLASESGLDLTTADALFVRLVNIKDAESFGQSVVSASAAKPRQSLFRALFDYLRQDWKSWTTGEQLSVGQVLFDLAFSADQSLASGAQEALRSVDIPSEVLAAILQVSQAGTLDVRGPPSAKRRRRSSSGTSTSRNEALKIVNAATGKIGLALELVDNNSPESKPELLSSLFSMLATLKRFQQNRVESPYLINLCLGCLRVILEKAEVNARNIDTSAIKPELVTDCLRSSDNPQVQTAALLVCASLSSIAPDQMLHNVMPIFTFIGHKLTAKDDEHSVNVINEAIDKIVPALVSSLQRSRHGQALHNSMAPVLASFTSAFDHIPQHRRIAFYQRLLICVGVDDFGFMLIAMLAAQKSKQALFVKFVHDLVSGLPAFSELRIYQQLVALAVDTISPTPKLATSVFNINRSSAPEEKLKYVEASLEAANAILRTPALKSGLQRLSRLSETNEEKTRIALHEAFSATLITLQDMRTTGEGVFTLARRGLEYILGLPSLAELLGMLTSILDSMDSELQPQALQILAAQLEGSRSQDGSVRYLALQLLDKLQSHLQPQANATLFQAALVCMDRISEMCGRKDPDSVVKAANSIVEYGLNHSEAPEKSQMAVLLTLASMVEVLKEAAVPIIPPMIPQILEVLRQCQTQRLSKEPVSNAACALLSAIVSHVAFIVTEQQLSEILAMVFTIKDDNPNSRGDSDIAQLTRSIARKVDLDIVIAASKSVLLSEGLAVERATPAVLGLCSQAMDHCSKSTVIKQADNISELFLIVLQNHVNRLQNSQAKQENEPEAKVSSELKAATIKFIYKINDTAFRPIFESWMDWTTSTADQDTEAIRMSRQTLLFDLLSHFFDTLKAIVTSYASYLISPFSAILSSSRPASDTKNQSSKTTRSTVSVPVPLLMNTLTLVRIIATHDADSFFAAPSHFDPLAAPLINTLTLAASKSTRSIIASHIVPTIIAFTTATQDSPSTHSTLATHIVALRRHSSPHVRLASIQTLLAITDDEDLGDEFIANTIGVGGGEGEGAKGGGGSIGEIMIYVNEMLEDDNEDVERSVRRWVQKVREKVGEEIFEV